LSNKTFYGEQQTEMWHSLRLGLFTSSTIYHLFEDSSKQAKAIALMQHLKDNKLRLSQDALKHRPTSDDLTYICKYLADYKFIKTADVPFLKKDLKAVIKGGSFSITDSKDCLLILTACHAMKHIEVASGSMLMLCKRKALELIYKSPDMDLDGIPAIEWGNETEDYAREVFKNQTLEMLDQRESKISFIKNFELQTGSSPDDTIN